MCRRPVTDNVMRKDFRVRSENEQDSQEYDNYLCNYISRAKKVLKIDDGLTPMILRYIKKKTIPIAASVPATGSVSGCQKYPR